MRNFFHSHWKAIVALVLLILVAVLTVSPSSTSAAAFAPELAERLRRHVDAIASSEHNTGTPAALERASVYIETALAQAGYIPTRQEYMSGGQRVRNIEAALGNVAQGKRPDRIFIVGAHVDLAPGAPGANDKGSGTAAVLELARLLRTMQPGAGTEVRFVFFVNEEPRWLIGEHRGSFIAFAGTTASSRLVREALAAFRDVSDFPAEGLAAPAHTTGVTLSDHASYQRHGYPALMITDTAFLRYPYYRTQEDTPEKITYDSMARVVAGLARTIAVLAGGTQG